MEEAIRTYLSEGFRRINFPKDVFRASDIAVYRRVVVDVLEEFKDKITIICSTDFSHTQSKPEADYTDSQSEQMLMALDSSGFFLEYIDSPPSVKLTIELVKRFYPTETIILGRANSSDFNHNQKSTTGYINALFINKDYRLGI